MLYLVPRCRHKLVNFELVVKHKVNDNGGIDDMLKSYVIKCYY